MTEVVLPLFADRHNHPYLYATLRAGLDLSAAADIEAGLEAIRGRLKGEPQQAAELLLCHGWSSAHGDLPLDSLTASAAVVVFHRSLHRLQLSPRAAEILANQHPDEISRLEDRNWFELNFPRVLNWFAGSGLTAAGLQDFYAWQRSLGIGYVEELLCCGGRELKLFEEAGLKDCTRFWASPETWAELDEGERAKVHGFKLFLDGAFGSWTAALREPYSDRLDTRGLLLFEDYELAEVIYRLAPLGKGLAIHAIGDAATEQAIRIFRQLGKRLHSYREVRLEHAQLLTRADALAAHQLGITLCMQPNFSIDSAVYRDRLGTQRAELNNPFRMLIDDVGFEPGIDLLFGTDGMPHGAEFAIRQGLEPPCSGQRLTLDELAAGFSGAPTGGGEIVCRFEEERLEIEIIPGK